MWWIIALPCLFAVPLAAWVIVGGSCQQNDDLINPRPMPPRPSKDSRDMGDETIYDCPCCDDTIARTALSHKTDGGQDE